MVLLALATIVVVLLVVHRSEGDLGRALVEYALVGCWRCCWPPPPPPPA